MYPLLGVEQITLKRNKQGHNISAGFDSIRCFLLSLSKCLSADPTLPLRSNRVDAGCVYGVSVGNYNNGKLSGRGAFSGNATSPLSLEGRTSIKSNQVASDGDVLMPESLIHTFVYVVVVASLSTSQCDMQQVLKVWGQSVSVTVVASTARREKRGS